MGSLGATRGSATKTTYRTWIEDTAKSIIADTNPDSTFSMGDVEAIAEAYQMQYMKDVDSDVIVRDLTDEISKQLKSQTQNTGIRGNVSFAEIVKASDNKISFDRTTTIIANGRIETIKKNDLANTLNKLGVTEFVGDMYRDKSGQNDLKRLADAGFEIQARYEGTSQGSIPPRDFYYFKKKRK